MKTVFNNMLIVLLVSEVVMKLLRIVCYFLYQYLKYDVFLFDHITIYNLGLFGYIMYEFIALFLVGYKRRGFKFLGSYFGQLGLILLGFLLFPISKLGIFSYLFNWSFDKSIRFHRLCGWASIWCVGLHLLFIAFQRHDVVFLFTWKGSFPVLPGTLAFLFMVLIVYTARDSFRRKHYMIFYIVY